jgi:hypothetical protein
MPHRWKPGLQVKSHTPEVQLAVAPFGGAAHVRHEGPHVVTESATQVPLQKLGVVVEPHRSPQLRPSQVAMVPLPTGPSGHGVHRAPQVATARFETHWPLHSWNPGLHWRPQAVPSHVAEPFTGTGHGVHEVPHVNTLVSDTHWLPH